MMPIFSAHRSDLPVIASFVAHENAQPHIQCLHWDTGGNQHAILAELTRLMASDEMRIMYCKEESALQACLGCEIDRQSGRGWLRGPLFTSGKFNPLDAQTILSQLLAHLPKEITRVDAFLPLENSPANSFYAAQGFTRIRIVHVYEASAEEFPGVAQTLLCPYVQAEELQPDALEVISTLHGSCFPTGYLSGSQLASNLDDNARLFLAQENDTVLGYCLSTIEESSDEGYIEFLAVDPKARGKGLGKRLLASALHWHFVERHLQKTHLTVDDENSNARSLYESVGFRLLHSGINWRRELPN